MAHPADGRGGMIVIAVIPGGPKDQTRNLEILGAQLRT
jgi:hypothetical protein